MTEIEEIKAKIEKIMEGFAYNESFFDNVICDSNRAYDIAIERGKVVGLQIALKILGKEVEDI